MRRVELAPLLQVGYRRDALLEVAIDVILRWMR